MASGFPFGVLDSIVEQDRGSDRMTPKVPNAAASV